MGIDYGSLTIVSTPDADHETPWLEVIEFPIDTSITLTTMPVPF